MIERLSDLWRRPFQECKITKFKLYINSYFQFEINFTYMVRKQGPILITERSIKQFLNAGAEPAQTGDN